MILAAAEKFSRAAEREDLAHGVFTYVMLEGLGGAADLDGDRSVSLRELSEYVMKHVPELTDDQQRPFVDIPDPLDSGAIRWPIR